MHLAFKSQSLIDLALAYAQLRQLVRKPVVDFLLVITGTSLLTFRPRRCQSKSIKGWVALGQNVRIMTS